MKHSGSICAHIAERDAWLVKSFRQHLRSALIIDLPKIFKEIAHSPAPRYFVDEERARVVIRDFRRTGQLSVKSKMRREMYLDLIDYIDSLMDRNSSLSFTEALYVAVNSPARSPYLTESTIRSLIYRNKK